MKTVCLHRGDRPEPFNSCILQAWSIGMYVHAFREMMLGMKVNMIENKIQIEPQIPESLRTNSIPINFKYRLDTIRGTGTFHFMVDPNDDRISVAFNGGELEVQPEIFSNTYSVNIEH